MAWACSATTHDRLVSNLYSEGLVTSLMVVEALRRVDRAWFVLAEYRHAAYDDTPLPIGYGATISAPHMHAIMLNVMAPALEQWRDRVGNSSAAGRPPMRILDVGSGSGYLTAVLAMMCQNACPNGDWAVHGIEHIPQLQRRSLLAFQTHFAEYGWLAEGREHVKLVVGDGREPTATPGLCTSYDLIHVGAAAAEVPLSYSQLLSLGGHLVIPVGPEKATQRLLVFTKRPDGTLDEAVNSCVQFVPLTSTEHQLRRA